MNRGFAFDRISGNSYLEMPVHFLSILKSLDDPQVAQGLHGNMIYDTIPGNGWVGEDNTKSQLPLRNSVLVNATLFHVTCGLFPNWKQSGESDGKTWNINTPIQNGTVAGGQANNPPMRLLCEPFQKRRWVSCSYRRDLADPGAIRILPTIYDHGGFDPPVRSFFTVTLNEEV